MTPAAQAGSSATASFAPLALPAAAIAHGVVRATGTAGAAGAAATGSATTEAATAVAEATVVAEEKAAEATWPRELGGGEGQSG